MAENSHIPTRGYKLLKERIEQNLGGVSKVGSGPGPNRWPLKKELSARGRVLCVEVIFQNIHVLFEHYFSNTAKSFMLSHVDIINTSQLSFLMDSLCPILWTRSNALDMSK